MKYWDITAETKESDAQVISYSCKVWTEKRSQLCKLLCTLPCYLSVCKKPYLLKKKEKSKESDEQLLDIEINLFHFEVSFKDIFNTCRL